MKFNRLFILTLSLIILGSITISCWSYPKTTSWADEAKKEVIGLASDKLKVVCPKGQVLSGFNLQRDEAQKKIKYRFSCLKHAGVGTKTKTVYNDWTERGTDFGTNYLDRQKVKCSTGYGIQSFELRNNGKLSYKYTCVQVSSRTCTTKDTPKKDAGSKFDSIFLDRQYPKASGPDQFIKEFQLRTTGNQFHYYVKSCVCFEKVVVIPPVLQDHFPNADNRPKKVKK